MAAACGRDPIYTRISRAATRPACGISSYENHPMKIVSAAEMREIDRATSERFGVPSINLMENAGSAVAHFTLSDYPQAERVGIFCGKGNNGGDGFAVAPKLVEAGPALRVLLLLDPKHLRGGSSVLLQKLLYQPQPPDNSP